MAYLLVFLGAGLGGMLRHAVNLLTVRAVGDQFPAGTMVVNVLGSLAMGVLAGWFLSRPGLGQDLRLFLTTGLLGGFTTFSAFSLDAALLLQRQAYLSALLYVAGSAIAAIAALFIGLALFRGGGQLP